MLTVTLQIRQQENDLLALKEQIAMALEFLGPVQVVEIKNDEGQLKMEV